MSNDTADLAANGPIPFLVPRFWLLVLNTIYLKIQHHRRSDVRYTDHLTQFYTRSSNKHVETYGDTYAEIRQQMVDFADLQPGDRVLDVATGGGYQAAAFADAGHHTVGLDYVHDRAQMAVEQHAGQPHLYWGAGDAAQLPFEANAFDVVSISLALHDMPLAVQMRALRELRRVARRRVVIVEPCAPETGWLWRWFYIRVGNVLDESLHFDDFVQRDFVSHLKATGLRLKIRRRVFHRLLVIYVCDV